MATPETPRHGQLLRRLHNIKANVSPDIVESIQPTQEINNPLAADLHRLRSEELVMCRATQGGVVGQFSKIYAMAGPGALWILEEAWFSNNSGVASAINGKLFAQTAFPPPNPVSPIQADARAIPVSGIVPDTAGQNGNAAMGANTEVGGVADPGIFMRIILPPFDIRVLPFRFVLFGGARIAWGATATNTAMDVTLRGWIRNLEPSETF